jgi:hypothetical protein
MSTILCRTQFCRGVPNGLESITHFYESILRTTRKRPPGSGTIIARISNMAGSAVGRTGYRGVEGVQIYSDPPPNAAYGAEAEVQTGTLPDGCTYGNLGKFGATCPKFTQSGMRKSGTRFSARIPL